MGRRLRSLFVLCVVALPGCVMWHQVPIPEPPAEPRIVANLTRVRLNSGQSPEFLTLVVATDSLVGIRNNEGRTRMSISLEQVTRIEERKKDAFRTVSLLAVLTFGVLFTGAAGPKLK